MSSRSNVAGAGGSVEWIGDLILEHDGRLAATFHSSKQRCVLEIANLAAFKTLSAGAAGWQARLGDAGLRRLAGFLPSSLEIVLHGVSIGRYEPSGPLNWVAKGAGLPFGTLVIDKLALLRASLRSP